MTDSLERLLRPRSIAVIGGTWAGNVVEQCQRMAFSGEIWPIHPRQQQVRGLKCFARIEDLPHAPDAVFIGINRFATVEAVEVLSKVGAGGVVCLRPASVKLQLKTNRA